MRAMPQIISGIVAALFCIGSGMMFTPAGRNYVLQQRLSNCPIDVSIMDSAAYPEHDLHVELTYLANWKSMKFVEIGKHLTQGDAAFVARINRTAAAKCAQKARQSI